MKLMQALYNMYDNKQSRLSFALDNEQQWTIFETLCDNIVRRNAFIKEHPIDSLILVLREPESYYDNDIEDDALVRFIKNSLVVTLIQMQILIDNNYTYDEALNLLYDNGFFAWLSSHGRHAASDGYIDTIDSIKRFGFWTE